MVPNAPTSVPPHAPPHWHDDLAGYSWTAQTIGHSSAMVFQLQADNRPSLFVKSELADDFSELPDEAARLRWLATSGVACPRVIDAIRAGQRHWLLMSALPGRDLASSPHLAAERIVTLTADALRALHDLDPSACPFDQRLDRRIAAAEARLRAGVVDESDFDEARLGLSAQSVFEDLLRRRPAQENLVVTHGDACLPNLVADAGAFTGFIDCARLGVADRHQDLALASWSIRYNLGEDWIAPFLQRYGLKTDRKLLDFYRLLDEFF